MRPRLQGRPCKGSSPGGRKLSMSNPDMGSRGIADLPLNPYNPWSKQSGRLPVSDFQFR